MNAREWKEQNYKRFTLKTGLDVVVKPLSPFRLMELGPIPKIEATDEEGYAQALKRIVQAGLVSPKLGDGEDEISLTDLTIEDANEITEAVMSITKRTDTEEGPPLADTASSAGPQSN